MLRYMVLGLLRGGARIHGYALWKAYERRSGHFIQNGKFYRALKSLAEAGLIRPMADPESDPRRTPYEITPAGVRAFDQWMVSVDAFDVAAEDSLSGRALFLFELDPETAQIFFVGLEDVLSARWKRLEYDRERVLSRPGVSERDRSIQSLLLTRNLERTSADLTWLREARAAYGALHGATSRVPVSPPASSSRTRTAGRAPR